MADRDWAGVGKVSFDVNRLGKAAAANTYPGTPPAYGMAFDMASAPALDSDSFNEFVRIQAEVSQRQLIDLAQRNISPAQHQRELEIAQNFETHGLSMANKGFTNTDDDDEGFFDRFGNDVQTGFNMLINKVGQAALGDTPDVSYEEYTAKGGALTEFEWEAFSPETRAQLYERAHVARDMAQVAGAPGVKQGLYALDKSYRGVITAGDVFGQFSEQTDLSVLFSKTAWAENWRASDDRSVGQMILDNLFRPVVGQDTIDEWAKHNAWYQMGAVATEFAATWHADLGVQAAKTAGNVRRVVHKEMPLNESGKMYSAIREAQQGREIISVRTAPAKKWASYRAERMSEGFDGLIDYAQAVDITTFAGAPNFRGRASSGQAAAKAIHVAANSRDPKLIELTRGALNGDLRSLRTIQQMKEDPTLASRFVGGANFVQAWDATKTRAPLLEAEIEKLVAKQETGAGSRFARWELDTDITVKQQELDEMKAWLDADKDYYDWLSSIGTTHVRPKSAIDSNVTAVDPYNPQLERYDAPKTKWNGVEERFDTVTHRRFMPDIYSTHHTYLKVPKALAARRVGVVSMHDIDSGKRNIDRFFHQLNMVLDFEDIDDLRSSVQAKWANPEFTNRQRYDTLYDMEERILIPALAGKLGISEATARAVFDKINFERNRTFEGLSSSGRRGTAFSSGASFAQRLQDETSTARVTSGVDDKGEYITHDDGMVTMEFREGQKIVTAEVHESMLAPRIGPQDVTQTVNYYQPADIRRMYYEMKRHADTLRAIDDLTGAGAVGAVQKFVRHDQQQLALVNNILATKFYGFWKPAQLWRLGWPQRVLMDEGFRAMAIFGPMYWMTGAGAESVALAARNTPAWIQNTYRTARHGKVNIAKAPLSSQRAADAFKWKAEAEQAVRLPAPMFPKIVPERLDRVMKVNVTAGREIAARDKARAIAREQGVEYVDIDTPAIDSHPLLKALAEADTFTSKSRTIRVYDPVTGKRVVKGHFVPLPNQGHSAAWRTGEERHVALNNLLYWYEQNAELLARRGVRIQVTNGEVKLGLWFNSRQRRKADEAMKAVARSQPIGQQTAKGLDLNHGEEWELLELDTPDPETFIDDALDPRLERVESDEPLSPTDALGEFDKQVNIIPRKKDYGVGRSHFRAHGKDYFVDDVFEGHLGRLTRALTSSAPAMDTLTDAHTAALGVLRHQGAQHVRIAAPAMTGEALKKGTPANRKAILYFQRWSDLLNNQVANSPVWGPMLRGATDADVVEYLMKDPKGHIHRREILEPHESVEAYVNEMRAKLDYYLPSMELRRRLGKGPIEPSDLRRKVHNDDLPDIYGPDLTLEDKRFTRALADTIWNALGTIPANKFSREPFAKATYQAKVRSLINQSDADFLDDAALERIRVMAAAHTREQIRQTLFDLTDGTNMTDALRFIAPFWGAQEEAILKWAKIISDRPETVARFMNGQRAIYNNVVVVDEEGNEVEQNRPNGSIFGFGFGYNPGDKMVLQIPDVVRKTPFGKALENIGAIGIPIGSANTVLQGEMPLAPSLGPWVTIPADKIMRAWSDTHLTEYADNIMYRWLFPIGRPGDGGHGILEQILPGWGRRALGAMGREDDAAYANLWMQMSREMTLHNAEKGLPAPTPEQVEAAAQLLWGARMFTSFVSPVQVEFRPHNQFWADEAHRYRKEYGQEWEQKFYEDYTEAAMAYAVSSSTSAAGVPPTSKGITTWAQPENKKLIAKHPELGGLIVGQGAWMDEFNHDTYEMQFGKNLGPGDSRTLREVSDPVVRRQQVEESIGWLEFRKIDATVQAELYALGLTNIQQEKAEDIARWRTDQIEALFREYPGWTLAWKTQEDTIYEEVEGLKEVARQPQFDNRADIQGLRDYLAIREQAAYQLDLAYANGTASRNLQVEENTVLREWFYTQVGTLVQNNPAFGEVYARYLTQDTLESGSGGYGG